MTTKRYMGYTDRRIAYADLETRFSSYNTKSEGLVLDSVTDDRNALDTLVNTTMQPNGGILDVVGVPRLASNVTIPANVTVNFIDGAYLAPDAGVTARINGKMRGALRKRFGGAGSVTFGRVSTRMRPEWWGAMADGSDDTIAFQNCARDVNATAVNVASGVTVGMGADATYLLTDTITVNQHRVHWEGAGKYSTQILFNPAAAKPCFKFQAANPAQIIFQCSLRKVSFTGQGAQQKIAIDLWDSSEFDVSEITCNAWTGNSGSGATPSIGLRTNGREILMCRGLDIFADRPIHIRVNPNAAANETTDHFHFTDIYFATQVASEAGILIDANCAPTNLTFDGYQAWIAGKYGLDYTAGGAGVSTMATFHNVRYEQSADATGYAVRWQGQSTQNLKFHSCHFGGANNNGTFMRNIARLTYDNCTFAGGAGTVCHDWTTCDQVMLVNTFSQVASSLVLGTLEEVFSPSPLAASGQPHAGTVYYCRPDLNAIRAIKVGGTYKYSYHAVVGNGGVFNLPLLTVGNGLKVAIVGVESYSATGPIQEGGVARVDAQAVIIRSGSANFVTTNTGGKLCLFFNTSGNPVVVINNTGQSVSLVVDVTASYT